MGGSLWRLSWDGELAEINPNTGQILRTITNPSWPTGLEGLTWDGTHFWFGVDNSSDLYRISADGGIQERITTPSRSNNGLAWDGQGLWIADDRSNSLLRYDPLNRSVTARIETGQESVQSVTCGGGSLWIGSNGLLQQVMY